MHIIVKLVEPLWRIRLCREATRAPQRPRGMGDVLMASPCLLAMLLAKSGKSQGSGDRVPGSSIKLLCYRSARDRQN